MNKSAPMFWWPGHGHQLDASWRQCRWWIETNAVGDKLQLWKIVENIFLFVQKDGQWAGWQQSLILPFSFSFLQRPSAWCNNNYHDHHTGCDSINNNNHNNNNNNGDHNNNGGSPDPGWWDLLLPGSDQRWQHWEPPTWGEREDCSQTFSTEEGTTPAVYGSLDVDYLWNFFNCLIKSMKKLI